MVKLYEERWTYRQNLQNHPFTMVFLSGWVPSPSFPQRRRSFVGSLRFCTSLFVTFVNAGHQRLSKKNVHTFFSLFSFVDSDSDSSSASPVLLTLAASLGV